MPKYKKHRDPQLNVNIPNKLYMCIKFVRSKCNVQLREFIITALVHHVIRTIKANHATFSVDESASWEPQLEAKDHWKVIEMFYNRIDSNPDLLEVTADRRRRLDKPFQSI